MSSDSNSSSPTKTLSQSDLQDLLLVDEQDRNMDFLPLFQDLTPGFESIYSPYSPIYTNTTTSSINSQCDDKIIIKSESKFHITDDDNSAVCISDTKKTIFFLFYRNTIIYFSF